MTDAEQIKKLKYELAKANANNRKRNLQLDALKFVWCDGGCSRGVNRWQDKEPTEEELFEIVRNTNRLIAWFINKYCKNGNDAQRKASTKEDKDFAYKAMCKEIEKFKERLKKSVE